MSSLPQQQPKRPGRSGMELLLELKRGSDDGTTTTSSNKANITLPAYNDVLVQTCIEELNSHLQNLEDQVQAVTSQSQSSQSSNSSPTGSSSKQKPPMSCRPAMLLENAIIQRLKRCLLTYHHVRMQTIQSNYWQQGGANSSNNSGGEQQSMQTTTTTTNLSPLEHEFQQEYSKLIFKYNQAMDVDITSMIVPPLPQDKVQIRVIRDDVFSYGTKSIMLESGTIVTFVKGSTHYLSFTDVEEYIQQGYLQLIDCEEHE